MANYYDGKLYPIGTQFRSWQGKEYMILGYGKVNYQVVDRAGKQWNYKMVAVTDASILEKQDKTWTVDGAKSQEVSTTFAQLKEAEAVVISGRGAGKFEGKTGYIAKVNDATYGVLIPNVGIIRASKALVKAAS